METLITRDELTDLLANTVATTMVSVVTATVPKMTGPAKLKPDVLKINKTNGSAVTGYDSIVEGRLRAEIIAECLAKNYLLSTPQIEAEIAARFTKGTSWHCPLLNAAGKPTVLAVHAKNGINGDAYLRMVIRSAGKPVYVDPVTSDTIDPGTLPLAPASTYENQGLENTVKFVVVSLANVIECAIGGKRYRVVDNLIDHSVPVRETLWNLACEYANENRTLQAV